MLLKLFFGLIMSSSVWAASPAIESFQAVENDFGFSAKIAFDQKVTELKPKVDFINETIQLDIPNTTVKEGKIQKRVDGTQVRTLLAYQLNSNTARLRIILAKGLKANTLKNSFQINSTESGFEFLTANGKSEDEKSEDEESVITKAEAVPKVESEAIDEAKIEAELMALSKSKKSTNTEPAKEIVKTEPKVNVKETSNLTESEIPVLTGAIVKKAKASEFSTWRITLGLVVVALFLVGLWIASSRWLHKKNLKNPQTHIRVVTQHYLGPKKSLAIVTVAGESILIGITEQNISHIKTLSLLDGEIAAVNEVTDFKSTLADVQSSGSSEEQVEDYAMKGIKDIVSDRLKGMRNLW